VPVLQGIIDRVLLTINNFSRIIRVDLTERSDVL